MVLDRRSRSRRGSRGRPTPTSSRPCAAATTAPSSSSTRATSAASPPTSSAWSRTTAARRTSRRRSSSPRCAACARPTGRSPSSRGSTRSPRTPASTSSGARAAPRRSPSTPTTASAPPTTAASSPPSPTPDAAVDAKQQLDHLCGAFGGLSESHHEILVLRELEGLSYREIGERMGLSRPGVESTLFRARRRLTEEYDELVSGQRCVRIQAIIAAAGGRRARRARPAAPRPPHLPLPALPPPGARRRASTPRRWRARRSAARIARVAGLLPLPAFLAPACGTAASRWRRCPSRWPPPGPRPSRSPRR